MAKYQPPSIGRVVHYVFRAKHGQGTKFVPVIVHRPAAVTNVHDDGLIDLECFTAPIDRQANRKESRVPFKDPDGAEETDELVGTWHWPEYQPPAEDKSAKEPRKKEPRKKAKDEAAAPAETPPTPAPEPESES